MKVPSITGLVTKTLEPALAAEVAVISSSATAALSLETQAATSLDEDEASSKLRHPNKPT